MDIQLLHDHCQAITLEIGLAIKQRNNSLPLLAMMHNTMDAFLHEDDTNLDSASGPRSFL
jgi:hypothetical protein